MEKDPDNIEVTHDYLNKDYDTKTGFMQARALAIEQVKHEFARIGTLIKNQYGDAGVNKLLSTWVKPDAASQAAAAALLNTTPPPPPPPSSPVTYIATGSTWKYLDNGSNQATAWDNLGFDDSSWKSGAAQLGYGDGDEKTVVGFGGSSSNKYITTYFRKTFNVANPSAVQSLNLDILRDDGAVVYLNGNEVYRTNMPTGTITYTTRASSAIEDSTFYSTSLSKSLLVSGTNVIAVEIHQSGPDSSDISFDFDLKGTTTATPPSTPDVPSAPTGLNASAVSASRIDLSWTDTSDNESNFILERSLTGTGAWSQMATPNANATSYSNTGLSASTHYFYRIRATNAGGDSGNATADATTADAPTPPTSGPVTYIATGATWKYLDNGSNQGTTWRATAFDDSAWKSGAAQLGYGDGDEKTVVGYGGNASNKYVTTYFRKSFNVADPSQVSNLALKILRDDGAVVYVNGTEVYRTNMPTGTIGYTTLASAAIEDTTFYSAAFSSSLLVAGNNVIAVEIHQGDAFSSDISFDFSLTATVMTTTGSSTLLAKPTNLTTTTSSSSTTKVISLVNDPTKPLI
jgi:Fibronectin type III domain